MAATDFWSNQERAQQVVGELKGLKTILKPLEEVLKAADNLSGARRDGARRRRSGG